MEMPDSVKLIEKQFIDMLDKDPECHTVPIKEVAKWEGMSYGAMLTMNNAHQLPYGMAYDVGERSYHHINKLVLFNFVNNGGRI